MDTIFGGLGAPVMLLLGAFVAITALLWFLLPFSVFGIKARLEEQIELLRSIENRLRELNRVLSAVQTQAVPATPEFEPPEKVEFDEPESPSTQPPEAAPRAPGDKATNDRWQRPG